MPDLKDLGQFGFRVTEVPTRDGSRAYVVRSPLTIFDCPVEAFFQEAAGEFRFFDEGFNLHSLQSRGIRPDDIWEVLESNLGRLGVTLNPDGEISYTTKAAFEPALAHFMLSIAMIDEWLEVRFCHGRTREEQLARNAAAYKVSHPRDRIPPDAVAPFAER
ncbi:hypothetical protein [Sutterella sp.]|uniref:hypothetical protein n=1 Tax=Sutterella sp. TaxID=1981025 RepID=UPI0026DEC346|nr:hypothetical protein [Sutterella sp.]MDO5531133.1 hypothetical protein [Sutterella sp.]